MSSTPLHKSGPNTDTTGNQLRVPCEPFALLKTHWGWFGNSLQVQRRLVMVLKKFCCQSLFRPIVSFPRSLLWAPKTYDGTAKGNRGQAIEQKASNSKIHTLTLDSSPVCCSAFGLLARGMFFSADRSHCVSCWVISSSKSCIILLIDCLFTSFTHL